MANCWRCRRGTGLALRGYDGLEADLGGGGIRGILFVTLSCWRGGKDEGEGGRRGVENC